MSTGKINVNTENIFPIIKKFLYSDHEIFLRELVSNAVDANMKLRTLAATGEAKGELGELQIEVRIDSEKKTLTISDTGIGMTAEEIDKYINQIAFSGAEEFVEKYKDKPEANAIIGHFGLGFYSSFMVASNVEIISKSYQEGAEAVRWECDGSPDFTLSAAEKESRGTDIILHIAEDSLEFLETARIQTLLNKYCKFLPIPIQFNGEQINNVKPAWTQKPADLSDEDYLAFYKELYPYSEEPLFHIHLNVDYPFNLTGILYFPRLKKNFEIQKNKIQLYSNQVFVTDSVEGIVPDFLTLLHGVLDSPDIPLNVSRSYLQSDGNVKKISSHITKKVADKLEDLFKTNREDFEAKWDDIRMFIQYGMLSDEKFGDRALKFNLLKNVAEKCFTHEEYLDHVCPLQTDKNEQVILLYAANKTEQHTFIDAAVQRGYDVLLMDSPLDSHLVNMLESKMEKVRFVRVDSDTVDKLIVKEDALPSKLSEEEQERLKPLIEKQVEGKMLSVQLESMSESDAPVIVTRPEFMRRMKDMAQVGGGNPFMADMPDSANLVINTNHPLIGRILSTDDADKQANLIRQATDLALLAQNMLKGEELTRFIRRSVELID
ncbi:MAG TPA: molecular chaperone HtpG [Flavobacteriales bacterium]|nr:molecular chaperone HtpG [Flavobacteriales bacterium]